MIRSGEMRSFVRPTLGLVAVYAAAMLALATGMDLWLRSFDDEMGRATNRLVGKEVAAALTDLSLERILKADPAVRMHLKEVIDGLTERSDVVASIVVVNDVGTVVTTDDPSVGRQMEPPSQVFGNDPRPRYFRLADRPLTGGSYKILIPLVRRGTVHGYLQILMDSAPVTELFAEARRDLLAAFLIGLAAVGSLAFLFQQRIARQADRLARALEDVRQGRAPDVGTPRDEFARAFQLAGEVGRELDASRQSRGRLEGRFGALARAIDAGLVVLDADREPEFANARALAAFGCEDLDALRVLWPPAREQIEASVGEGEGEGGAAQPRRVRVSFDRERAAELELEIYSPEGAGEQEIVLVKDRTALESLDSDLRLAGQARGLRHLYAALSHELRAPLHSLVVNLEVFRESLSDPELTDPESRRAAVDASLEEIQRLQRSLAALLSHAEPGSSEPTEFDLRSPLRDLHVLLEPQARRQGVECSLKLAAEPVLVEGFPDRIKQAILALAVNGLEAMPEGGQLDLVLDTTDGRANLVIRDTGPGIPDDQRERIFELRFTTKSDGSGIGLFVARSIVRSHGGRLRAEPSEGGAAFRIELPLAARAGS